MNTENCEPGTENWFLAAVPDVHDVAIFHNVVFAFEAEHTFGARVLPPIPPPATDPNESFRRG